ncbi:MAG TPA: I78 family peptidase inhibitor [Vitreimonas sp.]|uniref:I78 family peptidase inhibitor n=1 Tax=Vitreimonas sp. TaxID=3069702 RepID=UPI002D24E47C|nr:I78 family peptidase inhibitor [Vitreimonas sp.]HYD85951.1 I78 family peptidase inhibitor [Vitreimonas sp.]
MRAVLVAAMLAAAACTTAPAPQNAQEATAQDACGAARFAHLIGTPAAQIDRSTLPPRTRIITPDMMITQDFSAERLNITVGADGRVGSLRCF